MPGSNFDDVLLIDRYGHLAPRGPLKLATGEQNSELYIWVVQSRPDGAAFMTCEGMPTTDGQTWLMEAGSAEHKGRFQPGPAIGQGTVTAELNGETTVSVWSESIELTT